VTTLIKTIKAEKIRIHPKEEENNEGLYENRF